MDVVEREGVPPDGALTVAEIAAARMMGHALNRLKTGHSRLRVLRDPESPPELKVRALAVLLGDLAAVADWLTGELRYAIRDLAAGAWCWHAALLGDEDEGRGFASAVAVERERQRALHGRPENSAAKWVAVLTEEVGEVARAALDDNRPECKRAADPRAALIEELVQVATVCCAWLERWERYA